MKKEETSYNPRAREGKTTTVSFNTDFDMLLDCQRNLMSLPLIKSRSKYGRKKFNQTALFNEAIALYADEKNLPFLIKLHRRVEEEGTSLSEFVSRLFKKYGSSIDKI